MDTERGLSERIIIKSNNKYVLKNELSPVLALKMYACYSVVFILNPEGMNTVHLANSGLVWSLKLILPEK